MTVWDSDHRDDTPEQEPVQLVTPEGADWLASASGFPRSVRAMWSARPFAPSVLPCGTVFDVINMPELFGRRVLDELCPAGLGPVAVHRSRLLVFATPGAADRLPALMSWEEWASRIPPLLCHGPGDAVTIPPVRHSSESGAHWVVAPDTRAPWLPGPDVLLWACVRAARAEAARRGTESGRHGR